MKWRWKNTKHPEEKHNLISKKLSKKQAALEGGTGATAFSILKNDPGRYTPNYADRDDINQKEKEQSEKDLINEIDSKRRKPNRYAMTTSFKVNDGDDIVIDHEYTFTGVDAKNVTLSNPWHSGQKITMPKTKFLKITAGVDRLDMGE